MRTVSTRVLPVPAPASTSTGPSSVSTASRCSGLRPARYGAPAAACARAAMPPGAGPDGAAGSILRFKGSAKVTAVADSHAPKMAPGRGFYEARAGCVSGRRESADPHLSSPFQGEEARAAYHEFI